MAGIFKKFIFISQTESKTADFDMISENSFVIRCFCANDTILCNVSWIQDQKNMKGGRERAHPSSIAHSMTIHSTYTCSIHNKFRIMHN